MADVRLDKHVREITRLIEDANTCVEDNGPVEMEMMCIQRALALNDYLSMRYKVPGLIIREVGGMWAIGTKEDER